MRRERVAGLVVVLLVVGSATAVAAQPAVGTTFPDAEQACGTTGDGQHLIGILPGAATATDAQVLHGTDNPHSLYSGTTLKLALCEDGTLLHTYGSEWEISDSQDLEVLNTSDATATVRVTGTADEVDVLALVDSKNEIPAVSITVPQLPTAESELTNATLTFESQDAKTSYTDDESGFLAAESNLTDATEALNESAAAVESGDVDPENLPHESVVAVTRSTKTLDDRTAAFERQAYDTAFAASGESKVLGALDTANERERAADRKAKAALRNYLETLETAESDARSTALLNLVGALVVGLVAGAVPGWKLTASKLADIRHDREVNSSVNYSPRVLARAAGLAAAVLVLALVALAVLGGFGKLGGLL